ncbi:hypothetical protein Acr_06g0008470 [Actinidia rufa]|uniref:Uncharacterized protein n=1 Tax=Actinidia rufa TaxID=165716 RepID=A0A7J0ETJ7_9ERIC|nr:hypothetical protein Acr_06g0008470 [Actinidia rufa]
MNRRQDQVVFVVKLVDAALSIFVFSSNDEHSDILIRFPPQSVRGVKIVGLSSGNLDIIKLRNLKKAAPATNSSTATAPHIFLKSIDLIMGLVKMIVALTRAVMLPNDEKSVGDAACSSKEFASDAACPMEHSVKLKREKKKSSSLESDLKKAKLALANVDQLKADLVDAEQAWWWHVAQCTNESLTGANRVGDNYARQVTKVRSESFLEGWLACLVELVVLEDNPAWTKAAPALKFFEPPVPYSSMVLDSFDEEEYMNRENEDIPKPVLAHVMCYALQPGLCGLWGCDGRWLAHQDLCTFNLCIPI